MDLEEKERGFEERSERRDRDRRSGGRWGEERDERRDKRGSRFRDDERGSRESRWGREDDRTRREGRREVGGEDLNTRLQNLADGPNNPVSLLDMPDIPKPDGSDFGEYFQSPHST